MVLPSSIPNKGIAYCGEYHGVGDTITTNAIKAMAKEDKNNALVPILKPTQRFKGYFCRALISNPATRSIMAAIAANKNKFSVVKINLRIYPTNNS